MIYNDETPIIACSTSTSSNAAIAIIRVSGFQNLLDFQKIFSFDLTKTKNRFAHYCSLIDGNQLIDKIVFTYFKGPNTYNGENILELSVHGNKVNVDRIIKLFIDNFDLRYAKPGEFTYRALKNKKLSLTQVEGLDLFLNSNSEYGLSQGNSLLYGSLNSSYELLHQVFMNHKSSVEMGIDFLDDVGEEGFKENFEITLHDLDDLIRKLYERTTNNTFDLTVPKILILGKTNAGKSSLFNNLLSNERSIVSEIAGTTRDYISETISIEGNIFQIIDTAGLRETTDSIEEEGIARVEKLSNESFFKIHVVNPSEEAGAYEDLESDLQIHTHSEFKQSGNKIYLDNMNWNESYKSLILHSILMKYQELTSGEPIQIERQRHVISEIYKQFRSYRTTIKEEDDIAIISSELNIIGQSISELIGIVSPDAVLSNIFSNFCIGK